MINYVPFSEFYHSYKYPEEILKLGFHWNPFFRGYCYRFPVWRWNGSTTIEGLIIIYSERSQDETLLPMIRIETVRANGNDYYGPFYTYNDVYAKMIEKINKRILKRFEKLGIRGKYERVAESTNRKKTKPYNTRSNGIFKHKQKQII